MGKNKEDKKLLATLEKHSYLKICGILKLSKFKELSKLIQNFKTLKVLYHI
jgi:hypothetical protein